MYVRTFIQTYSTHEYILHCSSTASTYVHTVELIYPVIPRVAISIYVGFCCHCMYLYVSMYICTQVNCLIDEEELQEEIAYLKTLPLHPVALTCYNPRRSSLEANYFFQSPSLSLLMEWCAAIGRIYGVPVSVQCSIPVYAMTLYVRTSLDPQQNAQCSI